MAQSSNHDSSAPGPTPVPPILFLQHEAIEGTRIHTTERDIRYEYLTFDTELPCHFKVWSDDSAVPRPPNLKKTESPFNWPSSQKNIILSLSCIITFLSAYSAGAYSMASEPLRAKWNLSTVIFNTGVTTWALGFACSPMFLAPLSEINGRRPVFIASAIVFFVSQIGCAVTNSFAGMLVARFFVGAGASTFATMVGGVVSDIYHAQHRNTPMALYSGFALAGTGVGPLISAFIVQRVSWRWIFFSQVIALGLTIVFVVVYFNETRGSVLLSRRAAALNAYFEQLEQSGHNIPNPDSQSDKPTATANTRLRYKVSADETRSSLAQMLYLSLTLPFKLLATEPVVFFFSLWAAFAWAVLYMTFSVIPLVFRTRYNFTTQQSGAVFAAISIGTILATALSIYQDRLARRHYPQMAANPEGRLYFACLESALLPIGLFWFGWTASSSTNTSHWIAPVLALGCAQIGIFSIYLAVFNYLADVYHRYASSALAGQSFCRNLLAAVFPLFAEPMFRNGGPLGIAGASSLLGGVSALLTLVPWVLVFYGQSIRRRSRLASEIMAAAATTGAVAVDEGREDKVK